TAVDERGVSSQCPHLAIVRLDHVKAVASIEADGSVVHVQPGVFKPDSTTRIVAEPDHAVPVNGRVVNVPMQARARIQKHCDGGLPNPRVFAASSLGIATAGSFQADQSLCTFASAEIPRLRVDTELYIDDATQGYGPGTLTSGSVELSTELRAPTHPAYLQLIGGSTGVQVVDGNYVVTTDEGREFFALEQALPEAAVRRTKWSEDRNAMAVVDRTIQTLKKDLAGSCELEKGNDLEGEGRGIGQGACEESPAKAAKILDTPAEKDAERVGDTKKVKEAKEEVKEAKEKVKEAEQKVEKAKEEVEKAKAESESKDWCQKLLSQKLEFGAGDALLNTIGAKWDYCGRDDLVRDLQELNARRFVACRMLWQLRAANQVAFKAAGAPQNFAAFRAQCNQHLVPDDVLQAVLQDAMETTIVVLGVDGMQGLEGFDLRAEEAGKVKPFYEVMLEVCRLVNQKASPLVVGCISATQTLDHGLAWSPQRRYRLTLPRVTRVAENGEDKVPLHPLKDLLVRDMGGHGRALEALVQALQTASIGDGSAAAVIGAVMFQLTQKYPSAGILGRSDSKTFDDGSIKAILRTALSGKLVRSGDKLGNVDAEKADLIRLRYNDAATHYFIEVPYIWLHMMLKKVASVSEDLAPWGLMDYDQFLKDPPQDGTEWEEFNAAFRVLRSWAFEEEEAVPVGSLHSGAIIQP
ncbi:unnamed protein product, partial [Symbiodinium necroappetens]